MNELPTGTTLTDTLQNWAFQFYLRSDEKQAGVGVLNEERRQCSQEVRA